MIGEAVIEPATLDIDHRNHIRRIFVDQMKQLFPFDQLPSYPVNLHLLIDGVDIEKKNESHQPANYFRNALERDAILMRIQ